MEENINLENAAAIGENPDMFFIVLEGNRLHAVDKRIADLKKDESDPEQVLACMQDALTALIDFSQGKVEYHFLESAQEALANGADEHELRAKLEQIFKHLPHQERNHLSSLLHLSQKAHH